MDHDQLRDFLRRLIDEDQPWLMPEGVTAHDIAAVVRHETHLRGYVVVHLKTDLREEAEALGHQVEGLLLAQAARDGMIRARLEAALSGRPDLLESMARMQPDDLAGALRGRTALRKRAMEALRRHHLTAAVALSRAFAEIEASTARDVMLDEINRLFAEQSSV